MQRVSRHDWLFEARVVDAHKVIDLAAIGLVTFRHEGQYSRRLRKRLDNENTGHDRMVRKVPLEERLVDRHVLQGNDILASLARQHAIDHEKRIPVRQVFEDPADIHGVQDSLLKRSIASSSAAMRLAISAR